MKLSAIVLTAAAGASFVSGAAMAQFTASIVESDQGANVVVPGAVTYRLFVEFDSPVQKLLAVSGSAANHLIFTTDTELVNAGGAFAGQKQEDFAQFPISAMYDSYVTIGASGFAGNDTNYSPTFLDNDGMSAVIVGSSWMDDNDGWFDGDPSTPETGMVLIAQFTVTDGGNVSLQGSVDWSDESGELVRTPFAVQTPTPGSLALIGLAGLLGGRRRRA